ncbi:mfa1p [Saccharomyces arboricola H-6]|uniref:Mfa1p n=1 Tax=Saccharomyces arboricola (strain H-6 / AS 2.3317 / CBS 10644) TaxID=1160507 RepID=J8PXU6_SACAR|nr:mfa1p [Saccharomyces arboricola H-6]
MQPSTASAAPKHKTSAEKKDNYIIKGVFWDPACVIA